MFSKARCVMTLQQRLRRPGLEDVVQAEEPTERSSWCTSAILKKLSTARPASECSFRCTYLITCIASSLRRRNGTVAVDSCL